MFHTLFMNWRFCGLKNYHIKNLKSEKKHVKLEMMTLASLGDVISRWCDFDKFLNVIVWLQNYIFFTEQFDG